MKRLGRILVEEVDSKSDFMKILDVNKKRVDPREVEFEDLKGFYEIDDKYLYFWFDDEEDFFNTLTDYTEEDITDIKWLSYRPYDYEWIDSYSAEEDWKEGYVLSSLDEYNAKLLLEIYEYLDPYHYNKAQSEIKTKGDWQWMVDNQEDFANEIKSYLPDLADKLTQHYWYAKDTAISRGIETYMDGEFIEELYKPLKLEYTKGLGSRFEKVKIPLSEIMLMYSRVGSANTPLDQLIYEYVNSRYASYPNNPREYYYDFEDGEYLKEEFNKESLWTIEKELDKIKEDYENGDLEKFRELYQMIEKNYKFDQYIPVDKEKGIAIKIKLIDRDTLKIKVELSKFRNIETFGGLENRKVVDIKPTTLHSLINNHQLFDVFEN